MKTAIFSDIHGNTPALEATLDDIRRAGVDQVFVLGDIINGLDPHGAVRRLADWNAGGGPPLACIKGNAEMYLLTPDLDELPDRGMPWQGDLVRLIRWFETRLSAEDLAWIRTFPDYLIWNGACLAHDSPADRLVPESWHGQGIEPKYQEWFHHSRGIDESLAAEDWQALAGLMDARGLTQAFCGHTHVPLLKRFGDRLVCNTGSAGASLDGDPRPAWALVEGQPGAVPAVTLRRVNYDLEQAARLVDATPDYPDFSDPDFKEEYRNWLMTGRRHFG